MLIRKQTIVVFLAGNHSSTISMSENKRAHIGFTRMSKDNIQMGFARPSLSRIPILPTKTTRVRSSRSPIGYALQMRLETHEIV